MIGTKKNSSHKGSNSKASKPFFSKKGRVKPSADKKDAKENKKEEPKKDVEKKKSQPATAKKGNRLKQIGQFLGRKASSLNPFKKRQKGASTAAKKEKDPTKKGEPKAEEQTAVAASAKEVALKKPKTDSAPKVKKFSQPPPAGQLLDDQLLKEPAATPEKKTGETDQSTGKEQKPPQDQAESPSTETTPTPTPPAPTPEPAKAVEPPAPKPEVKPETKAEKKGEKKTEKESAEKKKKGEKEKPGKDGKKEKADAKKGGQKDQKPLEGGGGGGGGGGAPAAATTPPEPTLDGTSSEGLLGSLSSQKPTSFAQGMKQAKTLATTIQQKEKKDLKDEFPEIEQPTGLPVKGKGPKDKEKGQLKKEKAPDLGVKGSKEKQQIELNHPQTTAKANIANVPTPRPPAGEDQSFFQSAIRQGVSNLKTSDSSINTSAGARPKVELSGEANPEQNKQNQEESDTKINDEQLKADAETAKDFGEQDIFPAMEPEMLSPQIELSAAPESGPGSLGDIPASSTEVYAAFDQQAQEKMDLQIQAEMGKHETEKQKMEQDSEKEKLEGQAKIDQETAKVKAQQEAEQSKAKGEVSQHREDWKKENESVKSEYSGKSAAKKQEIDGQIDSKVQETDQKVDKELTDAEGKAESEKKKTEDEAKRKKKEAEEKNKKRSFWDRVASAISSFFDALKAALNTLFDGLRSLVKGIIELAKKAVNGLIELARKAIVGLIKAFGEALKALVSIALAAFPEIAKRINALIDKAVNAAVDLVNKLAEGLKNFVNALLDLIGAALDAILAAYQAFYNALLDALEFIAVGIIKILEGIANLVSSAGQAPGNFFGQMSEELLGQDVTKPLPNERPPATAPAADQIAQAQKQGEISDADAAFMSKSTYADGDIQADGTAQNEMLSPEIMAQLASTGDGVIEFGASNDKEHSMDAVKQDIMGGSPAAPANDPAAASTPAAPSPTPANTQEEGGDGLVGPFSGPGERAGYLIGQMTDGIKKWFSENQVAIIAALVLGITGVVLANILTGGAIMAALPLLMQIVSVYFAAEAIFNVSKYFGKYLVEAFPGQIAQGAVSLARGLAIGAIELVFALLFGGKAAMKAVKTGVKAAAKGGVKGVVKAGKSAAKSAAKSYVKANVKAAKELGKVAKDGAKATLKNGKAVVKGVKNGFSKGAKKLDDLGKRLSKKFRFRKFKIEVKNRKWRLLGQMNPWVLLSTGEIRHFEGSELTKRGRGVSKPVGNKVFVKGGGGEGIIVGVKKLDDGGSHFVDDVIDLGTDAKRKVKFDELSAKPKVDRRTDIMGKPTFDEAAFKAKFGPDAAAARKGRGGLASAIGSAGKYTDEVVDGTRKTFVNEAHHILPVELISQSPALRKAIEAGFDFNSKANGIWLKRFTSGKDILDKQGRVIASKAGVHASHPAYTKKLREALDRIPSGLTDAQTKAAVEQIMTDTRKLIESTPTKKLNDLFTK